jgi:DNA polymerase I-like protein with 3'-5' exonuclease and polymerase domains
MEHVHDRKAQNAWEMRQYKLPLVEFIDKPDLETPMCYVMDIEVKTGTVVRIKYFYVTEDEEVGHFIAWQEELRVLGYDLETSDLNPMDGKIATVQFGNPRVADPRVYVFDVRALSREAMQPMFKILRSKKKLKLGQNIKFECKWTQHHYAAPLRNVWDTQVAELSIRTGLMGSKAKGTYQRKDEDRTAYKHSSMAALSKRYLGIDIDKDHELRTGFFKTPIGDHSMRQIVYAGGDVVYPFYIAEQQKALLLERKLENVIKVEMGVIPVIADQELTGFRIDVKRWRTLWQEAVKARAEAERALDLIFLGQQPDLFASKDLNVRPIYTGSKKPQPLNYSASAQVKWAVKQICESRHWPVKLLTTEKQVQDQKAVYGKKWLDKKPGKTVKDIPDWVLPESEFMILLKGDQITLKLGMLRKQLPEDVVDLLLAYGKWDIRCDTFGNEFLKKHVRKDTGCIHAEFHQAVTNTGRMSSSAPNLQNIPMGKEYRSCFIPQPGYAFCIGDYSQIEPRITAQESGDETYTRTFKENLDLYLAVAEAMLGYRPDKNTPEGKLERKIFKTVVLALAYNMGKWKLRDRLTLALADEIRAGKVPAPSFEYASELWDKFFEAHPKVRVNQTRAIEEASPKIKKFFQEGEPELVANPRRIWDDFVGGEVTWVTAVCGRKRFFPPDALNCYTEAPNVGPQSGSATITKAAAWLIQQEIDEKGWDAHIVNLVHDEIVCMVKLEQAQAFAPIMKALMEKAGQHYCPDIPIKVEYPEGSNGVVAFWAKEVTEEESADMEAELEEAA